MGEKKELVVFTPEELEALQKIGCDAKGYLKDYFPATEVKLASTRKIYDIESPLDFEEFFGNSAAIDISIDPQKYSKWTKFATLVVSKGLTGLEMMARGQMREPQIPGVKMYVGVDASLPRPFTGYEVSETYKVLHDVCVGKDLKAVLRALVDEEFIGPTAMLVKFSFMNTIYIDARSKEVAIKETAGEKKKSPEEILGELAKLVPSELRKNAILVPQIDLKYNPSPDMENVNFLANLKKFHRALSRV